MKILFIGDPHLRINRFSLAIDLFSWIESEIDKHQPDLVVNLGDTFHDHAVLRSELLEEFRQHVLRVTPKVPYYYVLGNHDQYKPKDAKYHALQNFIGIKRFLVIDSPTELHDITFVPYLADHDQFPLDTKQICVAHQTFIGADYGYMRESAGVDAGKVKAEIIISGHIHKKQEFGKVVYPGIPYAQNANDVDQEKAILLFDTASYQKTWITSPFPSWRSLTYVVAADNPMDGLYGIIEQTVNQKDQWILNIEGPKAEIAAFLSSKRYQKIVENKTVMPRPTFTDKEKQAVSIKATETEVILHDFVEKVYTGSLDRNLLTGKLQEILSSVKSQKSS